MDKFIEYKLNIWEKEKKLITEYLENIRDYIAQHHIDGELYHDIEEMVFEKLTLETHLDQLKIKKILWEVWEPEVIFSDYVENKKSSLKQELPFEEKNTFYGKLIENWWERDNNWAIFLGVSWVCGEKLGVPTWWIRVWLLLLIIVFWLSVWCYILAWLVLPVKWLTYKKLSTLWYLQKQLYHLVKDFIYNTYNSIVYFIKFMCIKIFQMLKLAFSFTCKNIFPIIRFVFFGTLSLCFASILLTLLVVGAFYFSGFSMGNMEFTSVLPSYFLWGIVFWILSSVLLTFGTFSLAFSKKSLPKYVLTGAWVSFLIALFLWTATSFSLLEKYAGKIEYTQEASIDVTSLESDNIQFDISDLMSDNMFWLSSISWIKVESSTGNTITAKLERTIYGNEVISQAIETQLSDIQLKQDGNKIILWTQNNKIFKNKVPFSIFETDLILSLPQGKKYFIDGDYYYFINVHLAQKYGNYQEYMSSNCRFREVYYSQEEHTFVCDANQEEQENAKNSFLQAEFIKNFENISPLLHQDQYKRSYYNHYGSRSDWNFEDIYLSDPQTLVVRFWDMSLNIEAQVHFEDTQDWVIFSDFEIKNVEVEYGFQPKYYRDISAIQKFIPQEYSQSFPPEIYQDLLKIEK